MQVIKVELLYKLHFHFAPAKYNLCNRLINFKSVILIFEFTGLFI